MEDNTATVTQDDHRWPSKRGSEMHDTEYRDFIVATLAALNVKTDSLYGNGKKGRVELLEEKVSKLQILTIIIGLMTLGMNGDKISSVAMALAKFFIG